MALFSETWTGANGSAWAAQWSTVTFPGVGAVANIQTNKGRMTTGTSIYNGCGARNTTALASNDYTLTVDVVLPIMTEWYVFVNFRGSNVMDFFQQLQSSYQFRFSSTGGNILPEFWQIDAAGAEEYRTNASASGTPIAGDTLRIVIQVSGTTTTTLKQKAWKVGTTEPAYTDFSSFVSVAYTGAYFSLAVQGGNNTVSEAFDWDDLDISVISAGAPVNAQLATATCTASVAKASIRPPTGVSSVAGTAYNAVIGRLAAAGVATVTTSGGPAVPTSPQFVGTSAQVSGNSTVSFNLTPDVSALSLAANDVLIADFGGAATPAAALTITPPASQGWTAVTGSPFSHATLLSRKSLFWKRWGSGDTDDTTPTFACDIAGATDESAGGQISVWRGCVDSGDPYEAVASTLDGAALATYTAPTATSAGTTRTSLRFYGSQDDNAHASQSEGLLAYGGANYDFTAADDHAMSLSYLTGEGAGAIGTATMASGLNGSDAWIAVTMILTPLTAVATLSDATVRVRPNPSRALVTGTAYGGTITSQGLVNVGTLNITSTFDTPTLITTASSGVILSPMAIVSTFSTISAVGLAQVTTQHASYTFTTTGTFNVTHTATNAFGSGSVTKQVIVVAPGPPPTPPPTASFNVSVNPTQNSPVQFTDTSTGSPTFFVWNFGDGTATSSTQSPSHTYTTAGTFNVTLTASNFGGSNVFSSQVVVVAVGGGGAAGSSCSTAIPDFIVGTHGTLQQIVDNNDLTGRTVRIPAGIYNAGSYLLNVTNRDFGGVQIVCDPNAIMRSDNGVLMLGEILGLTWCGGIIETQGTSSIDGSGIYIDSNRTDLGANGNPGGRLTFDNITVRPIAGTGRIGRNGIGIWGCDQVTVRYCTVHDSSGNSAYGPGGAGSGMSFGHARRLPTNNTGVSHLIDHNIIYNQLQDRDGNSYDRNGIILDLFHGSEAGLYGDVVIGDIQITNNEVYDVDGRGITSHWSGTSNSRVIITGNYVHGRFADGLVPDGEPKAGIGAYSGGVPTMGNHLVSNNRVTPYGGWASYKFMQCPLGVTGTGNLGLPAVFQSSPGNSAPAGFAS